MEKKVKFNVRDKYLSGVLLSPKDATACVVLASGFLINMDGPRGIFIDLAKKLYKMGYGVLRFTYSDADGKKRREPLLEKNIAELKAAITFARQRFAKVYILGYSFSGMLAMFVARTFRPVERLILWAPFLGFKTSAQHDWQHLRKLKKVHRLSYWTMLKLLVYYMRQKGKVNFDALIRTLNMPILVLFGDKDEICDFSRIPELFRKRNMKVKLLKDADHFFRGHERAIVNTTTSWLERMDHDEREVRVL